MSPPVCEHYTLPCSPAAVCEDRFSILDTDDLTVPLWDLLSKLLTEHTVHDPASIIDILETIAVTLRGTAGTDYGFLKTFLVNNATEDFYSRVWPSLIELALRLPELFPSGRISILTSEHPKLELSREQIGCLVAHQFLCTLPAPTWQDGFQDFDLWYGSDQPHAQAVHAYLTSLFVYFHKIASWHVARTPATGMTPGRIRYELHHAGSSQPNSDSLYPLEILRLDEATTDPSVLGLPAGAAVISANKFIGFGRTGTQEEVHVGASPECCPAVLLTPPLADDHVLVITGPEAAITISGYGRDARCVQRLMPIDGCDSQWTRRTMLFMDALELDLADRLLGEPVDLQPGHVARELRKAQTAFLSRDEPYDTIYTGFWGCRTFGGNPAIKTAIQWCAASQAGSSLMFVCAGQEQHVFADDLQKFVDDVRDLSCSISSLQQALIDMTPEHVQGKDSIFGVILDMLRR